MTEYTEELKAAIYELGRMYYEMGYFAPADRIFSGLLELDEGFLEARIGLGLIKLERGLFQEAAKHFRFALQSNRTELSAKLGLSAAYLASGEMKRAQSVLTESSKVVGKIAVERPEIYRLFEAFLIRCT